MSDTIQKPFDRRVIEFLFRKPVATALIIGAAITVLASAAYRKTRSSLEGALGVRFPATVQFSIIDSYHYTDIDMYAITANRADLLEVEKEVLLRNSSYPVLPNDSFDIPKMVQNQRLFKEAVSAGHSFFASKVMARNEAAIIGYISDRESHAWIVKMRMRSALSMMVDRVFSFGLGIMILIVVVRNVSFPKYLSPKLKSEKTPAQ